MKKILLITHYNFSENGPIHGPAHSLTSFFERHHTFYKFIAHPLYFGEKSKVEVSDKTGVGRKEINFPSVSFLPIKSILETVLTLKNVSRDKYFLTIAIDPLNFIAAYLIKRFGWTKRVVYYSVDYAKNRFESSILNYFYHLIDRFSIKNADYVWSVSTRIFDLRREQGVETNRNFYIPNSPSFSAFKNATSTKKDPNRIIMVTGKTHEKILTKVVDAFQRVSRKFPRARLILVGPVDKNLFRNKKIITLGPLSHEKLIDEMSVSGIGLAIYTNDFPWTYFGDSMKTREYLVCGLPVVITNVVSTAKDIEVAKAGLVIRPNEREIYQALFTLLSNESLWTTSHKNAIKLARETDIDKNLDKFFKNI